MWKLLSGIALILLVDIVFIFWMSSEPEVQEFARAVRPVAAIPVIHEPRVSPPQMIDDSTEPVESEEEFVRETRSFRVPKRHASRNARRFDNQSSTPSAAAPANLFQDTVIWIGRTEVPGKIEARESFAVRSEPDRTGNVQSSVSETRVGKKRSFESKAFGVIKKPYELMKAFADKFN